VTQEVQPMEVMSHSEEAALGKGDISDEGNLAAGHGSYHSGRVIIAPMLFHDYVQAP